MAWLAQDRFVQKAKADDALACNAAAENGDPLEHCLPWVRVKLQGERHAQACDAALLPQLRPETRAAAQGFCLAGTKRLIATNDTLAAERDRALKEAGTARVALGEAVSRAEARATRSTKRKETADAVLDTAPRGNGGRIRCDADCLRRLAGS